MNSSDRMEVDGEVPPSLITELMTWLTTPRLASNDVIGVLINCGVHSLLALLQADESTLTNLTSQLKPIPKKKPQAALESSVSVII